MIHETEQDYKLEIRDSQNLAENEEQRNFRLQRLPESQSIGIQAETKQQRHYRLHIARDNTARRMTKQAIPLLIFSLILITCLKLYYLSEIIRRI